MCVPLVNLNVNTFNSVPANSVSTTSTAEEIVDEELTEEDLEAICLRLLAACETGAWNAPPKMNKVCLVTTGATAAFPELVQAALTPDCLQTFADNGFTKLVFQCGETFKVFNEMMPVDLKGIDVEAFDFKVAGLNQEMRECQAKEGVSTKGLLICHAGAGTILDGMRLGLSLIVVPNESLLDNHQGELAEELEVQGYATHSSIKGLAKAIDIACKKGDRPWVGQNASLAPIIDAVVGYEDDIRARLD